MRPFSLLRRRSALGTALQLVERDNPWSSAEELDDSIAQVETQIETGRQLVAKMFDMESKAEKRVLSKVAELERTSSDLVERKQFFGRYRWLSMEPLKWRDRAGLPCLAVFSPGSPISTITVRRDFAAVNYARISTSPELPLVMLECLNDLCKEFAKSLLVTNAVTLRAEYSGAVPDAIRAKIREAQADFEHIYILAEVEKWSVEEVVAPKQDPLVVGFARDKLWLIAAYDTTPIEELIVREFTA